MAKATFEYGKLAAGKIDYIFKVTAVADTYEEGEILVASVADGTKAVTWAKATAIDISKPHAVCAESVTLSGAGEIVVYKGGYFNKNIVKVNKLAITDNDIEALKAQSIIVEDVDKQ